jgi:hypothetical protein
MAPLGGDVLAAGLLSDPASDLRSRPQAATRRWSLHGFGEFLLLFGREQRWPFRGDQLQPMVPQAGWAFAVIAPDDATGIVFLQADQHGRRFGGHAVGDECQ